MTAHSAVVVESFCKLCDWTFQVWLNDREFFDENPRSAELQNSIAADALARLRTISQEYTLLQIAKLHDPAVVGGQVTLGIEYILKYGAWEERRLKRLTKLVETLNAFSQELRTVRNKSLAHNDLAAILSNQPLGMFPKGDDVRYFETLQEFVNEVHEGTIGGPWPFDDLVKNDVAHLLAIMKP